MLHTMHASGLIAAKYTRRFYRSYVEQQAPDPELLRFWLWHISGWALNPVWEMSFCRPVSDEWHRERV